MTLLRPQIDFPLYTESKCVQLPESAEDLFENLINPDSFHVSHRDDQGACSNAFTDLMEPYLASSNSNNLDVTTTADRDLNSWQYPTSSTQQQADELAKTCDRHFYKYPVSNSSIASPDMESVALSTGEIGLEDEYSQYEATAPSSPRCGARSRKRFDIPLLIRQRHSSASPCKIEKIQRQVAALRRVVSYKASNASTRFTKKLQDVAAAAELSATTTTSTYALATSPPYNKSQASSVEWDSSEAQAVCNPTQHHQDLDHAMSPPPNAYNRLQNECKPTSTPRGIEHNPSGPHVDLCNAEPQSQMSSYSSPPLDPHPEILSLTPPATQPMSATHWDTEENLFMHGFASTANKAEDWALTGVEPSEVTCGATAAAGSAGLGINFADHDNEDQERGLDFETYDPTGGAQGSQHHGMLHQQPADPTPRMQSSLCRRQSAEYSTSALSPGLSQSIYPLSPLLGQGSHDMSYTMPPSRLDIHQMYSPSTRQIPRHTYRPSHQRSYTTGTSVSSMPPLGFTQPTYAGTSFPSSLPSPSPPPHRSLVASSKQRSKSAHQGRRRSSNTSSHHSRQSSASKVGFVNFTPDDSRTILTGVAPSGSSKTKARREREAAEKRRKLGEAAKRAVLDAGGDLQALEREVLALGE